MSSYGETWLIYNGSSGSHDDERLQQIVDSLAASGHPVSRTIDCKDGTPDAREADASGVGLIAIHGGDGTLSRTISGLEGCHAKVLPLPGGTFNLLSREIFGERDPLDIVDMLGKGQLEVKRRTCIRGEGLLALAELLVGPGAKWADVREEMRESNIGEVIAKGWDAAATSTIGPMVGLTDPEEGREDGYAGIRLCPRADGIAIRGYAVEGLSEFLQQGIAILNRDFREGPHDDLGRAEAVSCHSLEGEPVPLMVDGERSEGPPTLTFSLDSVDVDLLGIPDGR